MRRVIIESPFAPRTPLPEGGCLRLGAGDDHTCFQVYGGPPPSAAHPCSWCVETRVRAEESALHARYLAACLHDSLMRGEAPFASHGLYTLPGVLRDDVPAEREHGIKAGFTWRGVAHATVFYVDLGWSGGMRAGAADANALAQNDREAHLVEIRTLGGEWDDIGRAFRDKYPR